MLPDLVRDLIRSEIEQIEDHVPSGPRWHRDLLDQSLAATDRRGAVLTEAVGASLDRYLAFRHFFRQAYSFALRWDDMRDLVADARSTWVTASEDIEGWLERTGEH